MACVPGLRPKAELRLRVEEAAVVGDVEALARAVRQWKRVDFSSLPREIEVVLSTTLSDEM